VAPFDAPRVLLDLARACGAQGGRAFAVGGCVRDWLMDRAIKDWDVEVFGLPADALRSTLERLGKVDEVGRSFGVYKLRARGSSEEFDVSIPRRDSKVGPGHRGIQVDGDPHMPIREAARRRDLTINAVMVDLATGRIEDPWGGMADLQARVLRAVDGDTFLEDPLRALRVVQFAARLGFDADASLIALCRTAALDELPPERIQGEWAKLLLQASEPSRGMKVAREAAIFPRVFPELEDAPATDAVLDALVATRAALVPEGRQWALMLAGWLSGQSPAAVEATLDRLWLHKFKGYPVREAVLAATAHWSDPCASDADLRWLSSRCEAGLALAVREALQGDAAEARIRAAELGVTERPPEPLLRGRDLPALGVEPGPAMGRLLARVWAQQLDGTVTSREQALEAARALVVAPP
jgi:tRNA nucleotidyltransferase (CCA-adding enzyme)